MLENESNVTPEVGASNAPTCYDWPTGLEIDASLLLQYVSHIRLKYNSLLERGLIEAAEAVEELFFDFWGGYSAEFKVPLYHAFQSPEEDGGKVLNQEPPYDHFPPLDWKGVHPACRHAKNATPKTDCPSVNDLYLVCKPLTKDYGKVDHRDMLLAIVRRCHDFMISHNAKVEARRK